MKVCFMCKERKPPSDFDFRGLLRAGEYFPYCRLCKSARRRKENRELKREVFAAYGGAKCRCCGENGHIDFLAIDHIENNGGAERRRLGLGGGRTFYAWLKRNKYPAGYQVLCHNCNVAKSFSGVCPHKFNSGIV